GKMIALVPSKRYAKVKDLLKDLERYFEGKEISEDVSTEAAAPVEDAPKGKGKPKAKSQKGGKKSASKAKKLPKALPVEEEEAPPKRTKSARIPKKKAGGTKILRAPSMEEYALEQEPPPPRRKKKAGTPPRKISGKTRMLKRDPRGESGRQKSRKGSGARKLRAEPEPTPELEEAPRERPLEIPEEEEDSRVVKGMSLADRRESKGDLGGAIEALQDVKDLAMDPAPLKERIVELRTRGFAQTRKEARAKEAEGDYRGAAKIFDQARIFVEDPEDIDEVVALLEEKHEDLLREGELAKLEEKAKARADEGDILGAVAVLEEAKAVAKNPVAVANKIKGLMKKAYEERIAECQAKEAEGDIEGAITAAGRAREFTESEDAVDAIVKNLERKREKASQQAEYKRYEDEALKRAEEGDIEGAIDCYERAKDFAASSIAVDAKIEDLRHSTYEGYLADASKCETSGEFKDAILAWEKARPYAPDPEEVEAAIQVLRDRIKSAEKERVVEKLRAEAAAFEQDGQIEDAIKKLRESSKHEKGPSYSTRLKIDNLQKKAFDDGVAHSNELKEKGDINGALKAVEAVRKFAPDPKAIDLILATLKREKSRSKRARDFRKLETAAKSKAKGGDILSSLKILEKAKEFAESPLAVQAKIDGLRKATYDRFMGEAKEKEVAGDWTEAEKLYSKARDFADDPARIDEI
ncbi:MAG: hypothetical protein ACYTFG_21420, partial [Planctomycetota bacterium]